MNVVTPATISVRYLDPLLVIPNHSSTLPQKPFFGAGNNPPPSGPLVIGSASGSCCCCACCSDILHPPLFFFRANECSYFTRDIYILTQEKQKSNRIATRRSHFAHKIFIRRHGSRPEQKGGASLRLLFIWV